MLKVPLNIQQFAASNTVEVELIAAANEVEKSMGAAIKAVKNLKSAVNSTENETNKLKKAAQEIKNAFSLDVNFSAIYNQIKRLGKSLYNLIFYRMS